ncbi:MAG: NUDIX hydrolase [Clostridia bacterium]|nr:NUDIX hydrolase [Clostridia bacterium]
MQAKMPTHIVAVAGVVEDEKGNILMVKTHNAGWVFPGGQVEEGEDLISALKREIQEESGIEIEAGPIFCISSNTKKNPGYNGISEIPTKVMLDFICTPVGGSLRGSDETEEARWIPKGEASAMMHTPVYIRRFQAYLNYQGRPQYLSYVTKPEFKLNMETEV